MQKDWIKNFSRLLVLSCAFNCRIPLYVWTASIDLCTSGVAKTWNGKWHRKWNRKRNGKRNETNKGKSNAISNVINLTDVLIIAKTIYIMYFLNIFLNGHDLQYCLVSFNIQGQISFSGLASKSAYEVLTIILFSYFLSSRLKKFVQYIILKQNETLSIFRKISAYICIHDGVFFT